MQGRWVTRATLIATVAVLLTACAGEIVSTTFQNVGETLDTPPAAAPSESPGASVETAGTISVVEGGAVGGPGGSIAEALAMGMTEPMLVNGVLFRGSDGTIYLADSVSDPATPTFADPILEVAHYTETEGEWDMVNAELLGLQEANGVVYREVQLYGVVAP
jgi:hypothetical protein